MMADKIPTFDFETVLDGNDDVKYNWFHDFMEHGVTLLKGILFLLFLLLYFLNRGKVAKK